MRKAQLVSGLVAALLMTGVALAQGTLLSSKDGRFTVQWPQKTLPNPSVQNLDTKVGKVTIHSYMASLGSQAFVVGFNDYPASAVAKMDPQNTLKGAMQGCVSNINGKLSTSQSITQNGRPGMAFTFSTKDGYFGSAKVVYDKGRLYQIMDIAKSKADLSSVQAKTFLSSFAITRDAAGGGALKHP